jgi:hypothetical protein
LCADGAGDSLADMLVIAILGVLAFGSAAALGMPPSRELMIKLATLLEWASRQDPDLYARQIAPISPFVGKTFKHSRLKGILRADMSGFGEICLRLQHEARRLDARAHFGLIPIAVYLTGLGLWFALHP